VRGNKFVKDANKVFVSPAGGKLVVEFVEFGLKLTGVMVGGVDVVNREWVGGTNSFFQREIVGWSNLRSQRIQVFAFVFDAKQGMKVVDRSLAGGGRVAVAVVVSNSNSNSFLYIYIYIYIY
jgi:hypothetical protein